MFLLVISGGLPQLCNSENDMNLTFQPKKKATETELALAEYQRNYMDAIVNTQETCTILKPKKQDFFRKKLLF